MNFNEYFCWILQDHYKLISFVEYVGRLPKNPLHNEHYIGYRCVMGQWIQNDDALIHLGDGKGVYKVNIAIYRGLQCSPVDNFFINYRNIPYWSKPKIIWGIYKERGHGGAGRKVSQWGRGYSKVNNAQTYLPDSSSSNDDNTQGFNIS